MEVNPADLVEQRAAAESWSPSDHANVEMILSGPAGNGVSKLDYVGTGIVVAHGDGWIEKGHGSGGQPTLQALFDLGERVTWRAGQLGLDQPEQPGQSG